MRLPHIGLIHRRSVLHICPTVIKSRSPKAYRSTIKLLGLEPSECAMVAAHIFDLRGAASVGMKTIYVPRPQEDADVMAEGLEIKSKKDGGEVDLVVGSFTELAEVVNGLRA